MDELDLVPIEKPMEEILGQHYKPTVEEILKDDDLIGIRGGECLAHHRMALDDSLLWQNLIRHHFA